jgi:hypothetical protein
LSDKNPSERSLIMSSGLIVDWSLNRNRGVIAGCSPDVHGQFFGFILGSVNDAGLIAFLQTHPQFSIIPDCRTGPSAHRVEFNAVGGFATEIHPPVQDRIAVATAAANFVRPIETPQEANATSDSPGDARSPATITAHAAAMSAHAEAASKHAEAASYHAKAAEAHAREAARHSAAARAMDTEENMAISNDSKENETGTETAAENAPAKPQARRDRSRK